MTIATNEAIHPHLMAIIQELHRAEKAHPDWPTKDIVHAAAIISEEAGELIREALHIRECETGISETYLEDLEKEAIQTAAMCLRLLKNLHHYKK